MWNFQGRSVRKNKGVRKLKSRKGTLGNEGRVLKNAVNSPGWGSAAKQAWRRLKKRPSTAMKLMFIAGKKAGFISAKKGPRKHMLKKRRY
jgi:hypothetical protein